jgi:hypothetical protein
MLVLVELTLDERFARKSIGSLLVYPSKNGQRVHLLALSTNDKAQIRRVVAPHAPPILKTLD